MKKTGNITTLRIVAPSASAADLPQKKEKKSKKKADGAIGGALLVR
jgi:hypothetical protein